MSDSASISTLQCPTIYDQLGGEASIKAAVEAFYERVLGDPLLQPFFANVDMAMQKAKQVEFLSHALGGPAPYRGPDMKQAHAHLPIEERHFARVAEHLVHTLQALSVPQALIDQIVTLIGPLAADIVNTPTAPEAGSSNGQPSSQNGRNSVMDTPSNQGSAAVMDAQTTENLMESTSALRATLDALQTNVMMADANLNVVYANDRSWTTLKSLRGAIKEAFGVEVEEIPGKSIHRFHKDPRRIEQILRNPAALPHEARFTFAGVTLQTRINGVYGPDHSVIGYVVVWDDITDRVRTETEMARVMSMMENAPINVMCTDMDFTIQYMNPASRKTLKTLESLLPVKVEDMIGQSIDIFHKNPSHQRKLLADPKNLPHSAHIQLGNETLDLLVSAIYDHAGTYLGPMVTWEVITEKLETERKIQEANEREREQAAKLQAGVTEIAEIGTTLASASEELTATSHQMASGAEETASQANVVAAASEEVSRNIQAVATGAEEMSATIKEVAKNTTESAKVASQAVNVAESANATVAKLGESSAEIGSIIKVITSIAQQTNLLALNATIEAARAGEAGKGFAVVANEVKELAKETTKATENIGRMIETIQTDTKGAVEAIAQISAIIKQVNDFQNTIASAVEEQSVTTNEMTRNVTEASKGSMEIASNIGSVAQVAKGTSEGASETQTAAKELAKLASDLQRVVSTLT